MSEFTKVYVGWQGQPGGSKFWMRGTPDEIRDKLNRRFALFNGKPPIEKKSATSSSSAKLPEQVAA